jgi:E3 ubiquitin-protein ligase SHPRH
MIFSLTFAKLIIICFKQLGQQKLKLMSDRIVGQNDTQRKLGQLLYLKNLSKAQTGLEGGSNPEPCPVCQAELGSKASHTICFWCIFVICSL